MPILRFFALQPPPKAGNHAPPAFGAVAKGVTESRCTFNAVVFAIGETDFPRRREPNLAAVTRRN
ncbi:MAG: hypothetical protein WA191_07495, partial [Telluria sp.]